MSSIAYFFVIESCWFRKRMSKNTTFKNNKPFLQHVPFSHSVWKLPTFWVSEITSAQIMFRWILSFVSFNFTSFSSSTFKMVRFPFLSLLFYIYCSSPLMNRFHIRKALMHSSSLSIVNIVNDVLNVAVYRLTILWYDYKINRVHNFFFSISKSSCNIVFYIFLYNNNTIFLYWYIFESIKFFTKIKQEVSAHVDQKINVLFVCLWFI